MPGRQSALAGHPIGVGVGECATWGPACWRGCVSVWGEVAVVRGSVGWGVLSSQGLVSVGVCVHQSRGPGST